jgi:peptide/nickel transport system substrate-binding protein
MTDWPLNRAYLDELSLNPDVKVEYYGPELGFDAVDINVDNSPNKAPGYPNPVYETNPAGFNQENGLYLASAAEFRKALWRTLNRDYLVANIWKGLGDPMYTVCTTAQGLYLHPNATVPVEAGGIMWSFDLVKAAKILDDAGFVDTDSPKDGLRNFPVSLGGDGKNIVLIYYGRSDDKLRNDIAVAHAGWIESIGVDVDLRLRDRSVTYPAVMIEKNFHLYTAGWSIGRDADSGMGLYYSGYYWHPGFCYNYGRVNCTDFDAHFEALEQANTNEEVIAWAWKCQYDYNMKALGTIPAVCNSGYKAYSKTYTGGTDGVAVSPDDGENEYRGQLWKDIVNLGSYGVDNYWTFLNAYPEGNLMGDGTHMTMRYGFKTALLEKPSNPCYAEWLWDWNILGLTYESLLYRDPYTYTWMPWLCKNFEVFTWVDPEDGQTKSGVRFTLRSDVYWSDGTPLTAADIEYSLVEMDDELINLGFGAPWWYSNTIYIKSFYIIDPCNVEVLLDIKSYFAVGWIGGCVILPKHIWKTLVEKEKAAPGTVNFWGAYVDPNVIGTGPYVFTEYDPIAPGHAMLVANSPGRVFKTSWPGSTTKTSTYGFFNYYPIYIDVHTLKEFVWYAGFEPTPPYVSSQWYQEKGPENGTQWHLDEWKDGQEPGEPGYGVLSQCDSILLAKKPALTTKVWEHVYYYNATTRQLWTDWYKQKIKPCTDAAIAVTIHNRWLDPIPNTEGAPNEGILTVTKHVQIINPEGVPIVDYVETKDLEPCVDWKEIFNFHVTKCNWKVIVTVHIDGPEFVYVSKFGGVISVLNPWACNTVTYKYYFWGTIKEDIGGTTYYDVIGLPTYPYKAQLPAPDCKVDIKDILTAAKAYGSYPGHSRWWSVCDVNGDYKVDIKDILGIAKAYGKV